MPWAIRERGHDGPDALLRADCAGRVVRYVARFTQTREGAEVSLSALTGGERTPGPDALSSWRTGSVLLWLHALRTRDRPRGALPGRLRYA